MTNPLPVRVRHWVRPTGWAGPLIGGVLTMAAWFAIAHSSGSGWVQALGVLLAATLIVGLVAPAVPAGLASVVCTVSPSDGQAGRPLEFTMTADRPVRLRLRSPGGVESSTIGPPRGGREITVEAVPPRRAVHTEVVLEVASCAPFGLVWWVRDVRVALPRPLHVAPRIDGAGRVESHDVDSPGQSPARIPGVVGEPRGVRPYEPGDPRRSVHWPATAHTGRLMVRESEQPADEPRWIEARLPADPDEAEREAERVHAEVLDCLVRGLPVLLTTTEDGQQVTRAIVDGIDAGRRLARAESPTTRTVSPR